MEWNPNFVKENLCSIGRNLIEEIAGSSLIFTWATSNATKEDSMDYGGCIDGNKK